MYELICSPQCSAAACSNKQSDCEVKKTCTEEDHSDKSPQGAQLGTRQDLRASRVEEELTLGVGMPQGPGQG